MVDDMCINFYLCQNCANTIASHKQCEIHGGQLAYRLLTNVTISTPGNILDKNTKLSTFWDMLHFVDRDTFHGAGETFWPQHHKNFAVNGSGLCVAFNISNQCMESNIVLAVSYFNISQHKFWDVTIGIVFG